jgi:hypothetical protein
VFDDRIGYPLRIAQRDLSDRFWLQLRSEVLHERCRLLIGFVQQVDPALRCDELNETGREPVQKCVLVERGRREQGLALRQAVAHQRFRDLQ